MDNEIPGATVATNQKRSRWTKPDGSISDVGCVVGVLGLHIILTVLAIALLVTHGESKVRGIVRSELGSPVMADEHVVNLQQELNRYHDRLVKVTGERDQASFAFTHTQAMLHEENKQGNTLAYILQEAAKRFRTGTASDGFNYLDAGVNRWIEIQEAKEKKTKQEPKENPIEKVLEKLLPAQAKNGHANERSSP